MRMKQSENIKVCNDSECNLKEMCNRYQPQIVSAPTHIKHITSPQPSPVGEGEKERHVCSYLLRGNKSGKLTQSKPGFAHNN
jgi:hypothetical protein